MGSFRPDRSANKSTVVHERRHDQNSIGSNDSRKMIIQKEIDFKVTRGDADDAQGVDHGRAI